MSAGMDDIVAELRTIRKLLWALTENKVGLPRPETLFGELTAKAGLGELQPSPCSREEFHERHQQDVARLAHMLGSGE